MAPAAFSASPWGREPEAMDHVYPPVPPPAESDCEYAVPTVGFGSEVVTMVSCGGETVMLSGLVAVTLELSITWTVKLAAPGAEGVPAITPAALRESPAGSE